MAENAPQQRSETAQLWQANILKSLLNALANRRLVIVVGAGVTLNATANEDGQILEHLMWRGLIKDGLRYLLEEGFTTSDDPRVRKAYQDLEGDDSESLLDAAGKMKRSLEEHEQFPTWLFSVFGDLKDRVKHPDILYTLRALHKEGATLVTTNYDDLLEATCGLNRIGRTNKQELYKFESGELDGVFHIHGSYHDPAEVVLNSIDYYIVQHDDDARETMKSFFRHKTILFVGCGAGLEDPNFEGLLGWAANKYKDITNRHILLLRDQDRPSAKLNSLLRARCGGPSWDGLGPYLNELLQAFRESRNNSAGGADTTRTNPAAVLELLHHSVRENVKLWLKAPDSLEQHYNACEKRHPDTGNWFINGNKFSTWLRTPKSFIWLHGFAGSGKSVLASTVIQRIVSHMQASASMGLAYFYLSYADTSKQSCRGVLSSLILQLSRQSSSDILNNLYADYVTGLPPQLALERTFKALAEQFDDVYIVADALDESPSGTARDAICKLMGLLREIKTVHLLVTSRDYPDIRSALETPTEAEVSIQNEATSADIRKYISEHLKDNRFSKWKSYHEEIEEALSRNSGGMFRLVDCQFLAIRSCLTPKMLRTALNTLPQTLYETYHLMLLAIKPEYEDIVRRTLAVLCFSARPVQICEIIEALATTVTKTGGSYDEEDKMSAAEDVLQMCPGMLTLIGPPDAKFDVPASEKGRGFSKEDVARRALRADRRIIALAHFSVREYLVSDQIVDAFPKYRLYPGIAHNWMARTCLVYLTHVGSNPSDLPASDPRSEIWHYGTFDFLDYALTSWSTHALKADPPTTIFPFIEAFRRSPSIYLALYVLNNREFTMFRPVTPEPHSQIITIRWLSYYGLSELLAVAFDLAEFPVKAPKSIKIPPSSPLSSTLKVTESPIPLGLRYGAGDYPGLQEIERNFAISRESAVSLALRNGHWRVVCQLLEKGFKPSTNASNVSKLNALQIAVRDGQSDAVSLILRDSADCEDYKRAKYKSGYHPFYLAVANGDTVIVTVLVDAGFSKSRFENMHNLTPLILAARRGHFEVVEVLLEALDRANNPLQKLEASTDYGMTAFTGAQGGGFYNIVTLLLAYREKWVMECRHDSRNYQFGDYYPRPPNTYSQVGKPKLPWRSRVLACDDMSAHGTDTPLRTGYWATDEEVDDEGCDAETDYGEAMEETDEGEENWETDDGEVGVEDHDAAVNAKTLDDEESNSISKEVVEEVYEGLSMMSTEEHAPMLTKALETRKKESKPRAGKKREINEAEDESQNRKEDAQNTLDDDNDGDDLNHKYATDEDQKGEEEDSDRLWNIDSSAEIEHTLPAWKSLPLFDLPLDSRYLYTNNSRGIQLAPSVISKRHLSTQDEGGN